MSSLLKKALEKVGALPPDEQDAIASQILAALADEVFIAHAAAGGHLESLTTRLRVWGIPNSFHTRLERSG